MIVGLTPYPRLALTAHIQLMAEDAMVLLVGLVLLQTSIINIGVTQCRIVYWGLAGVWVTMIAECTNAFWGTKEILPIVSYRALDGDVDRDRDERRLTTSGCGVGGCERGRCMAGTDDDCGAYCAFVGIHLRVCCAGEWAFCGADREEEELRDVGDALGGDWSGD
jgi:hypothetical protein